MATLQVTNTFIDGDIVSASNFNTNYSDIVTYINNRNTAAATWDAMRATHATNVPLTANNSTGTQDIANFQDNGTNVFQVFDGGIISLSANSYCRMVADGNDNIKGSGYTAVDFTSETSTNITASTAENKITITKNGHYFISVKVSHITDSSTSSYDGLRVDKNGSTFSTPLTSFGYQGVTGIWSYHYVDILYLEENDYLEFYTKDTYTSPSYVLVGGSANGLATAATSVYVSKLS